MENKGNNPEAICRMFIHTDRLHRKAVERAVGEFGVHRSQHFVLMHIARMGEEASQKKLAEHLEISPAALAVTLKKLEAEGYVERRRCESDSRVNTLGLTAKGWEVHRRSRERFAEIDRRMMSGFSEDETEQLRGFLARMQNNLAADLSGCEKEGNE